MIVYDGIFRVLNEFWHKLHFGKMKETFGKTEMKIPQARISEFVSVGFLTDGKNCRESCLLV